MAVPRETYNFVPPPLEIASPEDRAGKYTIEELQRMMEPLLAADAGAGLQTEAKWPAGYGFGVGVLISLALWAAIAMGAAHL